MPSVARFSIAPVRSLGLEHPTEIEVTERGVVEDRRFYLTDESNRLVDRIVVGRLVQVAAHTDHDATMLRLTFPDGKVVEDEVKLGDAVETPIHGRTGVGHVVIGPWGEALAPIAGRAIRVVRCDRPGGTRAGNPTSIVSDGSLRELARHAGVHAVDARRFRMLIDLHGAEAHEEDTWIGGRIQIGDAILRVTKTDARCAITTQHPESGDGRPRHPADRSSPTAAFAKASTRTSGYWPTSSGRGGCASATKLQSCRCRRRLRRLLRQRRADPPQDQDPGGGTERPRGVPPVPRPTRRRAGTAPQDRHAPNQESITQPQITNDAVAATGAPIAIAIATTTASILDPSAAGVRPAPNNATPATPDRTAIVASGAKK